MKPGISLRRKESDLPFPVSPSGEKPGRAGSPHAATAAAPPTRGLRPLVNPPAFPAVAISILPKRSRQGKTMASPDYFSLAGFGVTAIGRF
jgi:hypothetical protein